MEDQDNFQPHYQRALMNKAFSIFRIFLALATITLLDSCSFAKENKEVQKTIITPTLLEILEMTGVKHDGTLASIVDATQKAWLRPAGVERWQMGDTYEELAPKIAPLFNKLGILTEVRPTKKEYDYGVILGALVSRVRQRLASALQTWKEGVRFKKLVFLVGARPLDPEKESERDLYNATNKFLPIKAGWTRPEVAPTTETEMARMVFDQAALPEDFKDAVTVQFIDTPMQKLPNGEFRRPNTGDTVTQWLDDKDTTPGSVLAFSNQPYVDYQDAVLRTLLPESFAVETVGAQGSGNEPVGVVLDNLARWLYQEQKYLQTRSKK